METPTYLYEHIADEIGTQLEEGSISPASKLPSLRVMSARYSCSMSVVMQAYAKLEAQGRIYSVEKSGFYAAEQLSPPTPKPERAFATERPLQVPSRSMLGRIVEAGNDPSVVPLGAGIPDSNYLPIASLKRELNQLLKEEPQLFAHYSDEQGDPQLREEIQLIMEHRGVHVGSEEILLTNGCTEALSLAIQSCSAPGDSIAVECPAFLGILQVLKELKRNIIAVPTSHAEGMDLDRLEEALQGTEVKAVVMTSMYQNPLGFVMSSENRERAVALAGRYGATIIEDDVYHDCSFDRRDESCLKSLDSRGAIMYCSSFSKTLSPGMRIGWLIGGDKHGKCRSLKIAKTLGNSPLLQRTMARFLSSHRYQRQISHMRRAMNQQQQEMRALLSASLPEGTAISQPKGGYYLWVELPQDYDCMAIFELALQKGVSIVPGPAFAPDGRFRNCMRISFASPINEVIREGIGRLSDAVRQSYKPMASDS